MHITISCVGCSIVVGLFYQLFSLNQNIHFFHSCKGIIIILTIMIFYPFLSFAINTPMPNFDESAKYIKKFHSIAYHIFISASSCHALKLNFKDKIYFSILTFQVFAVWCMGSFVALKIHQKLAGIKHTLSAATLKARKQLLIALCVQLITPGLLIVFPLLITLISIILKANYLSSKYKFFLQFLKYILSFFSNI